MVNPRSPESEKPANAPSTKGPNVDVVELDEKEQSILFAATKIIKQMGMSS